MDFNEIKNTWKDSFKDEKHLDKEKIEAKLKIKSKSKTALNKIRKSYKFELIAGAGMYFIIVAGILSFIKFPSALIFIVIVTLLMGVSYFFAMQTYKKVIKTDLSGNRLINNLSGTIKFIERYVNLSKTTFFKYMIIPIAILIGMFMGIFAVSGDKSVIEIISSLENRSIIKMIIVFVVMSGIMIPLTQYMNKKMYKRHLDELKQCLREFEEAETENI